jgi:hypothetical protein
MNCFIYVISIATNKPNLNLFIDTEVPKFFLLFYNNYKFSVAQKMLCTPSPQDLLTYLLEIVLPRPQAASATIFSRYIKE